MDCDFNNIRLDDVYQSPARNSKPEIPSSGVGEFKQNGDVDIDQDLIAALSREYDLNLDEQGFPKHNLNQQDNEKWIENYNKFLKASNRVRKRNIELESPIDRQPDGNKKQKTAVEFANPWMISSNERQPGKNWDEEAKKYIRKDTKLDKMYRKYREKITEIIEDKNPEYYKTVIFNLLFLNFLAKKFSHCYGTDRYSEMEAMQKLLDVVEPMKDNIPFNIDKFLQGTIELSIIKNMLQELINKLDVEYITENNLINKRIKIYIQESKKLINELMSVPEPH